MARKVSCGKGIRRIAYRSFLVAVIGGLGLSSMSGASSPSGRANWSQHGDSPDGIIANNFWLASPDGQVWDFGNAGTYGSAAPMHLAHPVVAITPTADGAGYWLVAGDGGVFSYGDAPFFGSTGGIRLNKPIVAMAPTPDGAGYWLVASDGGVFSFGDASFFGSTGGITLNKPIVAMTPTPDGAGYWLVASDGGVFSFGDASFYGSTGGLMLDKPIVAAASTPDGKGYWLLASDGGIFSYGDASFHGSAAPDPSLDPVEKVLSTSTGQGYWIEDQNGTVYAFGDAQGAPPTTQGVLFQAVTPGDKAALFAFAQLGKPYIWGGNGPVGYDCSGLALASWQHADGVSFARVADDQYHTAGVPVGPGSLSTGDLVFWGTNTALWSTVYHTAIYVGGGRIVEATGDVVQLNSLGQWGQGDIMPVGRRP